jgi:hypothetical protein
LVIVLELIILQNIHLLIGFLSECGAAFYTFLEGIADQGFIVHSFTR